MLSGEQVLSSTTCPVSVNQALAAFSVLPSLGLKYAIEMEFHDLHVDCSHGALRIRGLSRARHFPASVERISSCHSSHGEDCCGDCCNRYLHFCVGESTEVGFLPLTGHVDPNTHFSGYRVNQELRRFEMWSRRLCFISSSYCGSFSRIRAKRYLPHPRHWLELAKLANVTC